MNVNTDIEKKYGRRYRTKTKKAMNKTKTQINILLKNG